MKKKNRFSTFFVIGIVLNIREDNINYTKSRSHLEVQVLSRRGVFHFRFQESARAHFDVHDVGVPEAVQQVLQLDERLSVVLDFPVILGHDVLKTGLVGKGFVHVSLGAATALLPYCAQAGRCETVRMSGQLEPRLLLWDARGRPTSRRLDVGGRCFLRLDTSHFGIRCRPSRGRAVVAQQHITGGCAQLESVLKK